MSSVSLSSSELASLLGTSTTASSSGIDLSSLLEAATGSTSEGIDVTTAVATAITAAETPETQWENQETTIEDQESALNTISTATGTVETDLAALNSSAGALSSIDVSSSDSSIATATADGKAAPGTVTVQVNNLAGTSSWYSGYSASSSTGLSAGSFSLQVGSGTATDITVTSGETLTELASGINDQDLGVTANVITDANGARLSIVSDSSGSASNITISDSSLLEFTQAEQGTNASLTVDGISISSASNTVTGAVSGLTINLAGADANTTVTLTATPDTSTISSAINQFVTDYNTLIGEVNDQFTYSSTSEPPLAGDSTLEMLQNYLLGAGSYSASGNGSISTLGSLGISMNNDGTLTVDGTTLDDAIQNNYSEVQNFFEGSSLNGFSSSLNTQLQRLTDSSDGAFTVELSSMKSNYTNLQEDVSNFQTNTIAPLQTRLTAEYDAAEIALEELNTAKEQINAELGNNTSSSGS
jgi:flagellar hook-associated protein 2